MDQNEQHEKSVVDAANHAGTDPKARAEAMILATVKNAEAQLDADYAKNKAMLEHQRANVKKYVAAMFGGK